MRKRYCTYSGEDDLYHINSATRREWEMIDSKLKLMNILYDFPEKKEFEFYVDSQANNQENHYWLRVRALD